jgi:hypothetical protein
MKSKILGLFFCLLHLVSFADEPVFAEFRLKAKSEVPVSLLYPEYHIVIRGGTAFIETTFDGEPKDNKGTASLTIHSGIDPTTKLPVKLTGTIRVEFEDPGWTRDKFLTRIDVPLVASNEGLAKLRMADQASAEVLWLDILAGGLTRFSDPMGIRVQSEYSVEVIKDPATK